MVALLESPWPILISGIAVEAVLAIMLLRSGRGRVLWTMLGVLGVVLAGLVLQWLVVTDREAIDNLLYDCEAAVEGNDLDRLLGHISPSAFEVRADARAVLERVAVRKARISDVEIAVDRSTNPPTATARFLALATGRDRKGELPYQSFLERLIVTLRLEGDRWLVGGYAIEDVRKL